MNEYYTPEELENYIKNYDSSIDCLVRKSKEFEFQHIIEISENDLYSEIPNQGEEMFLRLNFETQTYQQIISTKQPPDTIQVTENSHLAESEIRTDLEIDGKKTKVLIRIIE